MQLFLDIIKNKPNFVPRKNRIVALSDGVTGNTSDFGSEESRFEPWSDNKAIPMIYRDCLFKAKELTVNG